MLKKETPRFYCADRNAEFAEFAGYNERFIC
jgi:hypothetical protein